jgi:hypothetical protein
VPRLPQLRFDQRMQLIRLNTGLSGRRGNGLFVVLLEDVAERAELCDGVDTDADLDLSHSNMGMARIAS